MNACEDFSRVDALRARSGIVGADVRRLFAAAGSEEKANLLTPTPAMKSISRHALIVLASLLLALAGANAPATETVQRNTMKLTSTAFSEGKPIPAKYTCDGADISPPLQWSGVPAAAKALVLIADDPDAPVGTWVHWVVFNMPASLTELAENQPKGQTLPAGGSQGLTDFKKPGYGGPCPPPGKPHRYFFKLYALDTQLTLKPSVTKKDVERAMEGHVLAQGELMGTYKR